MRGFYNAPVPREPGAGGALGLLRPGRGGANTVVPKDNPDTLMEVSIKSVPRARSPWAWATASKIFLTAQIKRSISSVVVRFSLWAVRL